MSLSPMLTAAAGACCASEGVGVVKANATLKANRLNDDENVVRISPLLFAHHTARVLLRTPHVNAEQVCAFVGNAARSS